MRQHKNPVSSFLSCISMKAEGPSLSVSKSNNVHACTRVYTHTAVPFRGMLESMGILFRGEQKSPFVLNIFSSKCRCLIAISHGKPSDSLLRTTAGTRAVAVTITTEAENRKFYSISHLLWNASCKKKSYSKFFFS